MSTTTMTALDTIIQKARQEERPLAIGYVTAGFPAQEDFASTLKKFAAHCDIIEIAIPFSDPVADSPTAERLELDAAKRGINLHFVFKTLEALPTELTNRIVLSGYYNNFLQYGLSRLAADCLRFSVTSLVIYDLPFGEYAGIDAPFQELRLIPLLGAATSDERLQAYSNFSAPYAYITPAIEASGVEKALALCCLTQKKAQQHLKIPVGIRYDVMTLPEEIKRQMPIFWYESSLLEHMEQGKEIADYFATLS